MKHTLKILLLCLLPLIGAGQINIVLPREVVTESRLDLRLKAFGDSLVKTLGTTTPEKPTEPGGPALTNCPEGPQISKISNVTPTSLLLLFHGLGVTKLQVTIYDLSGKQVREQTFDPLSSQLAVTYTPLPAGRYKLIVKGLNCNGQDSEDFDIPDSGVEVTPPVEGKIFEVLINTTGYGFSADELHGISPEWVERIEAFKYDWGWGITGISICMPWNSFEPTPGNYRLDGIQKNIDFCKSRGLSLSYKFWGLRDRKDGFLREDEMQRGAKGDLLSFGGQVSPSYGCDRTNALIFTAVQQVATKLKTYNKAGYLILAGGHTEELVYAAPFNGEGEKSQGTDLSPDNLSRFNKWVAARGITTPGHPPMRNGISWPGPEFNHPLGLEFGRFLTYSMRKYLDNFIDAVKSVSDIPVIYYYAAHSGGQMPSTNNANFNWIAERADGMYGTDGGLLDGAKGKSLVNSINRGTFPNGISAAEIDPEDVAYRGWGLPYCHNQIQYGQMEDAITNLFSRGLRYMHFAMAFCPQEIRGMSPYLQRIFQQYAGKPYVAPVVTASNTVEVNVVSGYRNGYNYFWDINPDQNYVKVVDTGFFGGVSPFVE